MVGFEGSYEVSNLGRVRSLDRVKECKHWDHYNGRIIKEMRRFRGQVLRPGPQSPSGHLSVAIGKGNSRLVHALVLEAFVGPCPDGRECCHADDNPSNNRLDNLRWGTRSDNLLDAVRNGKKPVGERSPRAKLRTHDVQGIKARLKADSRRGVLACLGREYRISWAVIRDIRDGKTWKSVQ